MASPVADSYSVASGGTIYAGNAVPYATPAWLASAAAFDVVSVPNSQPSLSSGIQPAVGGAIGTTGISSLVIAWAGAFAHGGKYHLHCGGDGDYGGNEIVFFDLLLDSPLDWDVLIERTAAADVVGGVNYLNDGRPAARHTYYAMGVADFGGTPKMARLNGNMGMAFFGAGFGGSANVRTVDIDLLNLVTKSWEVGAASMPRITGSETSCAQHPTTGDFYTWDGPGGNIIEMYDVSAGTSSQVADLAGTEGLAGAIVVDAVNDKLIRFGGAAASGAVYWPLAGGSKTTFSMSGAAASAVDALTDKGMGIAHDTLRNVVYLYTLDGTIHRVALNTGEATTVTPGSGTIGTPTNNWWGRVRYIPEIDAVVSIANWTSPLKAMRVS